MGYSLVCWPLFWDDIFVLVKHLECVGVESVDSATPQKQSAWCIGTDCLAFWLFFFFFWQSFWYWRQIILSLHRQQELKHKLSLNPEMTIENCKLYALSCDFLTVFMKESSNAIKDCHSLRFSFFKGVKLYHKDTLLANRLYFVFQQIFAIYFKKAFDTIKWNDPNEWSSLFLFDFLNFTVFSNYPLWNATLLVLVHVCVFAGSSKNTVSCCCCLVFFWCIKINNTGSMPPKNGDDVRTCGIPSWKNSFSKYYILLLIT